MRVIQDGRVTLNGVQVKEPSTPVDPSRDRVTVDGRKIEARNLEYVMLHKPAAFVTTKEDEHAERTVMDLLPQHLKHLVPVGRLDKDTEGLLLLTNDGDLTFQMTHPQFEVDKKYLVRIGGPLVAEKRRRLQEGVMIEGGVTAPARILDVKETDGQTEFMLVIHEGRKRQVRLMMKALGCSVRYLKRLSQGPLELGDLPVGHWRALTASEIALLKGLKRTQDKKPAAKPASAQKHVKDMIGRRTRSCGHTKRFQDKHRKPRFER